MAQVVEKFGDRLKALGLQVREFTGDMQLSRQEIIDSQLIVTTPEKWDVVTRKSGDGSLGSLVSLIIGTYMMRPCTLFGSLLTSFEP